MVNIVQRKNFWLNWQKKIFFVNIIGRNIFLSALTEENYYL